jgi:cytochrome c oxidase subunit IV
MEKEARFRPTLGFAIGMLLVQYVLGMAINLFVTIPTDHPGANPAEYFGGVVSSVSWAILHGGLLLTLHAVWGLVLVLGAIGTLVQAIRLGGGARVTWSALGLFGVLAAGFNGGSFLNYNQDFSSMLMAIGWALGMTSYVVLLYRGASS